MNDPRPNPIEKIKKYLPYCYFITACALALVVILSTAGKITDSDAASELILGQSLRLKGGLPLTTDWFYSTELRVLNTQLIYTLLFYFTDSYYLVRLWGAIILCVLLVLSYLVFARGVGLSRESFWYGAGFVLMPMSVAHSRIVLMHNFYMPHLMIGFLLIGIVMYLFRQDGISKRKRAILLFILYILSYFSGLGGPRQIAITLAPLLLSMFWRFFYKSPSSLFSDEVKSRIPIIFVLFFSFAGYFTNELILLKIYHFHRYARIGIKDFNWALIERGLRYLLQLAGYYPGAPLLSFRGISSMAAIFTLSVFIVTAVNSGKNAESINKEDETRIIISRLFLTSLICFQLTGHMIFGAEYVLYYIPLFALAFPSFLAYYQTKKEQNTIIQTIMLFVLCGSLVNGITVTRWFATGCSSNKGIAYTGLSNENAHSVLEIEGVKQFLLRNNCTYGYATFWHCNVLSEVTDNKINGININIVDQGVIAFYDWLSIPSLRNIIPGRAFLLLHEGELKNMSQRVSELKPLDEYHDALYHVYIYDRETIKQFFIKPQAQ